MIKIHNFILILLLAIFGQQLQFSKAKELDLKDCATNFKKSIAIGNELINGVKDIYNMLQLKTTDKNESIVEVKSEMEKNLTIQVNHMFHELDNLKLDMLKTKEEIFDKIHNEIPDIKILRNNLFQIYLHIKQIENSYNKFITYVTEPTKFRKDTLLNFAEYTISHGLNNLSNTLETIYWLLIQNDFEAGENILTILSRSTQTPKQMCNRKQSRQQMLSNLYDTIVIADIKAYTMIQISHHITKFFNGGNIFGENELTQQKFETLINNILKHFKSAMATATRTVWTCDSDGYKKGVTYTKLKNVFQKYIINEVDLNVDGTCTGTCPDYKKAKAHSCYDKTICSEQRTCHGNLWDCDYENVNGHSICPSKTSSNRRYRYIQYGNGERYGLKGDCPSKTIEGHSWNRGFVECSYCMCTCDDLGYEKSDRYVNLQPVLADYPNNFVVTGMRFVKSNHILHLQIQQGILLPNGLINESSVNWKSIYDYNINKPSLAINGTTFDNLPKENEDYHVLQYKIERGLDRDDSVFIKKSAVNLDDLDFATHERGDNHVVTGLKFSVNNIPNSGYHLNLEIHMTPFNFSTGLIDRTKSIWYSTFKDFNGRERLVLKSEKFEVKLDDLDIPTNSEAASIPTSQTDNFLYFTTSSLEKDAGQNTIPFIDLQAIETYPHSPLSGAGIFHKSSPGSGGFLALKLFTFNLEPHITLNTK